jgi:hypothetical protein
LRPTASSGFTHRAATSSHSSKHLPFSMKPNPGHFYQQTHPSIKLWTLPFSMKHNPKHFCQHTQSSNTLNPPLFLHHSFHACLMYLFI